MTELFTSISGSRLYGVNTDDSDYDYITVNIESPTQVFSAAPPKATQTGSPTDRTLPGESESTVYTLRHFVSLARQGNPNVLPVVFNDRLLDVCPDETLKTTVLTYLVANRDMFLSKQAVPRFKGYMMSQRDRLSGLKKKHVPNRPELIEKYSFDTKFAMHACRMGIMGCELHEEGTLSVPMKPGDIKFLKDVRTGKYTEPEVLDMVKHYISRLDQPKNVLPNKPLDDKIDNWLYLAHTNAWSKEGYGIQPYV